MSNFQTHYPFKLDFQNWTNIQEASGQLMALDAATPISCKAWNSPVEYPSREYKHDIKESKGNMFNPILKENVQGWKYPRSCASAEPKPLSYRKPKHLVQNKKNGNSLIW